MYSVTIKFQENLTLTSSMVKEDKLILILLVLHHDDKIDCESWSGDAYL